MSEVNEQEVPTVDKVADAVLKSDQSWDVLQAMYVECTRKIMSTQGFVGLVSSNIESLRETLSDPEGFETSFTTLISDIRRIGSGINATLEQHKGRTGTPTEEDWPLVFGVSMEYSRLTSDFDIVVAPLMMNLIETIRAEHGDSLSI